MGQKFWVFWAEFLQGHWDVALVYHFITVVVGLLELEEKAILCLIVAQGRRVAAIFLQPKEPPTIDLLIHFNTEEERKAEEKEHPKPKLGQR